MEKEKLHSLLQALHRDLSQSDTVDEKSGELLKTLLADIQRVLEQGGPSAASASSSDSKADDANGGAAGDDTVAASDDHSLAGRLSGRRAPSRGRTIPR